MKKSFIIPTALSAVVMLVVAAAAFGYPKPTRYNCFGGSGGGRIVRIFPPVLVRKPDGFSDTRRVALKRLLLPKIFDQATHRWRDPSNGWFARYRWTRQYQFASVSLTSKMRRKGRPTVMIAFAVPRENPGGVAARKFILRWEHSRRAELLAIGPAGRTLIPLRVLRPLTVGGRVWHLKLFRFTAAVSPRRALVFVRLPALRMRIQSRADPNLHFPAFHIHRRQRRVLLRFFRRAKLPTRWVARPPVNHAPTRPISARRDP